MEAEFPKMLYRDGAPYDPVTGAHVAHQHTRVVADAAEEAQAALAGYFPAGGGDGLTAEEGDDTIEGEGAAEPDAFNGADPAAFDHDHDGKPGGAPKGGNRRRKS